MPGRGNAMERPWYAPEEMQRRSTLWFVLAAAWFVLFVLNILRHRDKNTVVIGAAVAAFLVIGAMYRRREMQGPGKKKLK
jgi:hypothetical protein